MTREEYLTQRNTGVFNNGIFWSFYQENCKKCMDFNQFKQFFPTWLNQIHLTSPMDIILHYYDRKLEVVCLMDKEGKPIKYY